MKKQNREIKELNKAEKKHTTRKRILWITAALLAALLVGCFIYLGDYYHCSDVAAALADDDKVTVKQEKKWVFFDGPGETDAIVFYPGGKVEAAAYAPLMRKLAEQGFDTFLVEMPFRLAIFGSGRMADVRAQYEYDNWYLGGHSLGGVMAASYAAKHPDEPAGLFFLAAYAANDLKKVSFPVLSIYGSEDRVLNMEDLEKGRALMPEAYEEVCIEGGNHSGFAYYGPQKGDGEALISKDEQIALTAEVISAYFRK